MMESCPNSFSRSRRRPTAAIARNASLWIFTEANTWDKLRANVRGAVNACFFDQPEPTNIRLHWVEDEMLAVR